MTVMLLCRKALYSAVVAFFLACLTFPLSVGQYMASKVGLHQENYSWLELKAGVSNLFTSRATLEEKKTLLLFSVNMNGNIITINHYGNKMKIKYKLLLFAVNRNKFKDT